MNSKIGWRDWGGIKAYWVIGRVKGKVKSGERSGQSKVKVTGTTETDYTDQVVLVGGITWQNDGFVKWNKTLKGSHV